MDVKLVRGCQISMRQGCQICIVEFKKKKSWKRRRRREEEEERGERRKSMRGGGRRREEWLTFKNPALHHSFSRYSLSSPEELRHGPSSEINNGTSACVIQTKIGHKKGGRRRGVKCEVWATRSSVDVGVWTRIPAKNSPGEYCFNIRVW